MHDLTSATDPRLAPYSRVGDAAWLLSRGLFVAEGRLVVERLMDAKRFTIESILLTPAANHALALRLEAVDAEVLVCSPETMKQVTGFNFHRGCLALARRPPIATIDSWLEREGVLLALEAVGNPDNVGGLFRTAAAFGASGIFVSPSTADPLYRKVTLRIVPFLFLCYVVSFLDRINIGFAQLQMKHDLVGSCCSLVQKGLA